MHQLNQVGGSTRRIVRAICKPWHSSELKNVDLTLHYIFPRVQSDDAVEKRGGDGLIFTSQQN